MINITIRQINNGFVVAFCKENYTHEAYYKTLESAYREISEFYELNQGSTITPGAGAGFFPFFVPKGD